MLLSCNYNYINHIGIDFYCQDVKVQNVTFVSSLSGQNQKLTLYWVKIPLITAIHFLAGF
jgi:hypothetical protein